MDPQHWFNVSSLFFQAYISTNFTTTPNTPGRFIVWFRNETTLLVLWQPPYPAGFYTDYKERTADKNHRLFQTNMLSVRLLNIAYIFAFKDFTQQ
jgi:hypothetical protein